MIVAQDSYDKLNEAVGQFNDILDTWTIKPLTAVEAVTAGGSCSAGYEKLTTASWPGESESESETELERERESESETETESG